MSSPVPVFFIFAIILLAMGIVWFVTPKGPNQTLIRTSLMLTLMCCYLMWAVTYLAQVYPLETPRKAAGKEI
ncbi:ATPase, V0 complex, subunit E1/e2 [Fomitopsis serialis]|uniref:ATPase, V0 complex, subunit E1/e2 n=1 Tax=Fomitopsis serialis TaxID=139415 RepID=UPI002007DFAF|nr:ATPase, V0 complex, subunit E1/e2 [Neoantrodia serialis]KAH9930013.1 ATPase, V0 complex, subunit E1/e2 [Neoantrodia serialis]